MEELKPPPVVVDTWRYRDLAMPLPNPGLLYEGTKWHSRHSRVAIILGSELILLSQLECSLLGLFETTLKVFQGRRLGRNEAYLPPEPRLMKACKVRSSFIYRYNELILLRTSNDTGTWSLKICCGLQGSLPAAQWVRCQRLRIGLGTVGLSCDTDTEVRRLGRTNPDAVAQKWLKDKRWLPCRSYEQRAEIESIAP